MNQKFGCSKSVQEPTRILVQDPIPEPIGNLGESQLAQNQS